MVLWRPCDAVESAVAWKAAIERKDGPACLVFSRQNLTHQPRDRAALENIRRGGYVLRNCKGRPQALIIATGSEVGVAVEAARALEAKGIRVRVISMPSSNVFDAQDPEYREKVLPPRIKARVAIEAGVPDFWAKYVGLQGKVIGMSRFGESAPGGALFKHFGFTAENVAKTVEEIL